MPLESCVRYAPEDATLLMGNHIEIWQGLPSEYAFEEAPSQGGRLGLRVKSDGRHIWVNPDTRAFVVTEPERPLVVLGWRRAGGEIYFWSVSVDYASPPWPSREHSSSNAEYLQRMIEKAKEINGETLRQLMWKQEEERRKRPIPPAAATSKLSRDNEREAAYQTGWRRVR